MLAKTSPLVKWESVFVVSRVIDGCAHACRKPIYEIVQINICTIFDVRCTLVARNPDILSQNGPRKQEIVISWCWLLWKRDTRQEGIGSRRDVLRPLMSEHRERRQRAVSTKAFTNHPCSAAAHNPKRRPSLASPLPPTPIVPSTRPIPSVTNHQRSFQQHPSTATSVSSTNLSEPPSTRALMKRLLAKPAPPSSPIAPFLSPSMRPGFHHANPNTNEDDHETHITCSQDQDLGRHFITISSSPPADAPMTSRSTNEFDNSMRALDLVGQIDISMAPCTTPGLDFNEEPPGFAKKQRNVFRSSPSGTAPARVTTPPVPTLPSSGTPFFSFLLSFCLPILFRIPYWF